MRNIKKSIKLIPDYEKYGVNKAGEIVNVGTGNKLKPFRNNTGTLQVELYKDGIGKKFSVNALIRMSSSKTK